MCSAWFVDFIYAVYFMYDALFLLPGCEQIAGENLENYAQLDSLCLSVTEHALGSSLGRYTYHPHGPACL